MVNARLVSNHMVIHLRNLTDWNSLRNDNFRTHNSSFSLRDCLNEIYEMMNMKATAKNLKIGLEIMSVIPS